MADFTADDAPLLALVLLHCMAQAFDLCPLMSAEPSFHGFPILISLFPSLNLLRPSKQIEKSETKAHGTQLTNSSVHSTSLTLSFVQYLTCSVPLLLPGKNSEIRFQVMSCFSFSSISSASSSSVNFAFGPECGRGRGGRDGGA